MTMLMIALRVSTSRTIQGIERFPSCGLKSMAKSLVYGVSDWTWDG